MANGVAIVTFRDTAIHWNASIFESFEVLLCGGWPASCHVGALGLGRGEIVDSIFLADVALKIYDSEHVSMLLLLWMRI